MPLWLMAVGTRAVQTRETLGLLTNSREVRRCSPKCLERLSEKSLSGLWSVGFGSATRQERALYAPFEQFVRSLLLGSREFSDSLRRGILGSSPCPAREATQY